MDFVSVLYWYFLFVKIKRKAMTETIGSVQIIINKMLNKKATNHKFCFAYCFVDNHTHAHHSCWWVSLKLFLRFCARKNLDKLNNEKQRHVKPKWITNKSNIPHGQTQKAAYKGPKATPRLLYKQTRLVNYLFCNKKKVVHFSFALFSTHSIGKQKSLKKID